MLVLPTVGLEHPSVGAIPPSHQTGPGAVDDVASLTAEAELDPVWCCSYLDLL
jgi:hypothetical protein